MFGAISFDDLRPNASQPAPRGPLCVYRFLTTGPAAFRLWTECLNVPATTSINRQTLRLGRVGELLWAGILLQAAPNKSGVKQDTRNQAGRQSIRKSIALIRTAFADQHTWSPSSLRQRLRLTHHQTKAALRCLVDDGYLTVSGRTRGALYTLAATATTTEEDRRLSA